LKQVANSSGTQIPPSALTPDSTTQAAKSGTGMQLNPLDPHSLGLSQNQHRYAFHNNQQANLATSTETVTRTTLAFHSSPITYVLLGVTVEDELRLA
jgi:hypothetical protein